MILFERIGKNKIMSNIETKPLFTDTEAGTSPNTILTPEASLQSIVFGVSDIVSGVHRAIDQWRLSRAKDRAEELDESRFVYAESADIEANLAPFSLLPLRPDGQDPKGRNRRSREIASIKEHLDVQVNRPINPDLTPVSRGERRQAKRAADREAKSKALRYQRQAGLRNTWGNDIGTPEFVARIEGARMSKSEKRKALQEHQRFLRIGSKATRIHERVQRSAEGRDIPGQVIQYRLDRSLDTISRLSGKRYGIQNSRIGGLLARRYEEERLLA